MLKLLIFGWILTQLVKHWKMFARYIFCTCIFSKLNWAFFHKLAQHHGCWFSNIFKAHRNDDERTHHWSTRMRISSCVTFFYFFRTDAGAAALETAEMLQADTSVRAPRSPKKNSDAIKKRVRHGKHTWWWLGCWMRAWLSPKNRFNSIKKLPENVRLTRSYHAHQTLRSALEAKHRQPNQLARTLFFSTPACFSNSITLLWPLSRATTTMMRRRRRRGGG